MQPANDVTPPAPVSVTATKKPGKEPITVWELRSPDWKRGGQVFQGSVWSGHHAQILPGERIRLFGQADKTYGRREDGTMGLLEGGVYRIDFRIGDQAAYGGHNFTYTGTIRSITEKSVIVVEEGGQVHRMSLYDFARKNYDFDAAKIERERKAWLD